MCTSFPGSRWMLTTYCRLPCIISATVLDFDNGNVNLTKCISCFLLNLELKTGFGLHVPIAAKRNAFCTHIMGGLWDTTFIRLIIYTVVPTWEYNVCNAWQTTYKCLSPNALACKESKSCLYYFAPDRAEGWKASSRVTCSYCVECNKTRSSSTVSDHEHSSSAVNLNFS